VEKYFYYALMSFRNCRLLNWNLFLVSLNNSCGLSGIKRSGLPLSPVRLIFARGGASAKERKPKGSVGASQVS
jgi:hypothetical protein